MATTTSQRREKRRRIWKAQGRKCIYCALSLPFAASTLDHVRPKARGGTDAYENLVVACAPCNRQRGARKPETRLRRFGIGVPIEQWRAMSTAPISVTRARKVVNVGGQKSAVPNV